MSRTLSEILIDINAVLDLEAASPSGTELTTRANYANQAVLDAAATGQLSEFKREFLTTSTTLATIPLPDNFREAMENPRLYLSGGWEEWELVEVEQKYERSSGERYCYVLGNPSEGYNLIFNQIEPTDQLSFIYQRYPSGLLTLADKCELSDPQVVARKAEAYVLYSRSDDRFQVAQQMADRQLANMLGREMKGTTSGARKTKTTFQNPLSREA